MPRLAALLPLALLFTACRPTEKQGQPDQVPTTKNGIPLPPEIVASMGIGIKDERAGIILLLQDARLPLQQFQSSGLGMLISRQAGYKLTTQDAGGKAIQQMEQFRQAIADRPAAIFVSPIDPPALAALIVEAQTAGIIVIGLDKRMVNEGCASVVFSDQRRIGDLAARTVLEALKRKADDENRPETTGRVVQFRGAEDNYPDNELAEGFLAGLAKTPGVVVVHDSPVEWKTENLVHRYNEVVRLQKQFDVIFAHNDTTAAALAKAATDAGHRETLFIIGTDGIAEAPGQKKGMDLVREGDLDATIIQPALVDLALQIVLKLRTDKNFKPLPGYEIEPVVAVPKNVEQRLRMGTYTLPKL